MFARSFRSMFAAFAVALAVVPAAAYADGSTPSTPAAGQRQAVHQEKKDKDRAFPISTSVFKAHMERNMAKARERLSDRLAKRGLDGDKLKVAMTRFDAGSAKILGEVDKVGAGGSITKEGAKDIRAFARGVRLEMRDAHEKAPRHAK